MPSAAKKQSYEIQVSRSEEDIYCWLLWRAICFLFDGLCFVTDLITTCYSVWLNVGVVC